MLYHHVKHTFPPVRHFSGVADEKIQDRIRQRRLALGLSKVDLARLCGVTKQAVQGWEDGGTKAPSGPNLVVAAVALKAREEWLVTGEGPLDRAEVIDRDELTLLGKYRRMSQRDKAILQSMADNLVPHDLPFTGTT